MAFRNSKTALYNSLGQTITLPEVTEQMAKEVRDYANPLVNTFSGQSEFEGTQIGEAYEIKVRMPGATGAPSDPKEVSAFAARFNVHSLNGNVIPEPCDITGPPSSDDDPSPKAFYLLTSCYDTLYCIPTTDHVTTQVTKPGDNMPIKYGRGPAYGGLQRSGKFDLGRRSRNAGITDPDPECPAQTAINESARTNAANYVGALPLNEGSFGGGSGDLTQDLIAQLQAAGLGALGGAMPGVALAGLGVGTTQIMGSEFSIGYSPAITFQSVPATDAAQRAAALYTAAKAVGDQMGQYNSKTFEQPGPGREWIRANIYEAVKPGHGWWAEKLSTSKESFWSSWFFKLAFMNHWDTPGMKKPKNRGGTYYDYAQDEATKLRVQVFENPLQYLGQEMFFSFRPSEAPLQVGDCVFNTRDKTQISSFETIMNAGPSHMRVITSIVPDGDGFKATVNGGNEGNRVGIGTFKLDSRQVLTKPSQNGWSYLAIYKRVRIVAVGANRWNGTEPLDSLDSSGQYGESDPDAPFGQTDPNDTNYSTSSPEGTGETQGDAGTGVTFEDETTTTPVDDASDPYATSDVE